MTREINKPINFPGRDLFSIRVYDKVTTHHNRICRDLNLRLIGELIFRITTGFRLGCRRKHSGRFSIIVPVAKKMFIILILIVY